MPNVIGNARKLFPPAFRAGWVIQEVEMVVEFMNQARWIPLKEIDDNEKIWAGTRVRLYDVGLNVMDKTNDYYDYLVSFIYGNDEYLQLTNLSQGEAGNIVCVLKKDLPNHYSTGKVLKETMDIEKSFILYE